MHIFTLSFEVSAPSKQTLDNTAAALHEGAVALGASKVSITQLDSKTIDGGGTIANEQLLLSITASVPKDQRYALMELVESICQQNKCCVDGMTICKDQHAEEDAPGPSIEQCIHFVIKDGDPPAFVGEMAQRLQTNLENKKHTIICLPRQMYKTTTAAAGAVWLASNFENKTVLWLSLHDRLVKDAQQRLHEALQALEANGGQLTHTQEAGSITLSNGTRILLSNYAQSNARGLSLDLVILDELACVPDETAANVMAEVMPAASHGVVLAISTLTPKQSVFSDLWDAAVEGEGPFSPIHYPYHAHPDRPENGEWVQQMKAVMGEPTFNAEILCISPSAKTYTPSKPAPTSNQAGYDNAYRVLDEDNASAATNPAYEPAPLDSKENVDQPVLFIQQDDKPELEAELQAIGASTDTSGIFDVETVDMVVLFTKTPVEFKVTTFRAQIPSNVLLVPISCTDIDSASVIPSGAPLPITLRGFSNNGAPIDRLHLTGPLFDNKEANGFDTNETPYAPFVASLFGTDAQGKLGGEMVLFDTRMMVDIEVHDYNNIETVGSFESKKAFVVVYDSEGSNANNFVLIESKND
jgi:hypothetical protein